MEEFCPRCGTARVGAFRYCRACRLDFDDLFVAPAPTAFAVPIGSSVVTAGRSLRRSAGQSLLATGMLMLVGIAAIGGIQRIEIESTTSTGQPAANGATAANPTPAGPIGGQRTAAPVEPQATANPEPQTTANPGRGPQPKPDPKPRRGIFGNPWGYDFGVGQTISNPPADFCEYFDCTPGFWDQPAGFVVQCKDRTFSRSGGLEDACAANGGVRRTLSRH